MLIAASDLGTSTRIRGHTGRSLEMPERISDLVGRSVTRRTALAWIVSSTSGLLAACATTAPTAAPTAVPKPTDPPKPAAPAPTSAPAATAAPASAAAPAAAKPAAAATRWGMTPEQDAAWKQVEDAARKEGQITYY